MLQKKGAAYSSLSSPTVTEASPKVKALLGVPADDSTDGKNEPYSPSGESKGCCTVVEKFNIDKIRNSTYECLFYRFFL